MLFLKQLILFRPKNSGLVLWSKGQKDGADLILGLIKNQFFFFPNTSFFPKFWAPFY